MPTDPLQLILLLDVQAPVALDEIKDLLPERRWERRVLRLSGHGGPPGDAKAPFDWDGLGGAVERLLAEARKVIDEAGDHAPQIYLAGRAPLPLLVQAGQRLSKFVGEQFILNKDFGSAWEKYPLGVPGAGDGAPFFGVVSGLERAYPGSGRVAVFVSTVGAPASEDAIERFCSANNAALAGIVEVRTAGPGAITPDNVTHVAQELARTLSRVQGHYPRSRGVALFVAGPAQLGFMAGRAINPNILPDVWVAHYAAPDYEFALALPLRDTGHAVAAPSAEERLAQQHAFGRVHEGIAQLQQHLSADDFPPRFSVQQRETWLGQLRGLKVSAQPEDAAFSLSLLQRELRIGRGLLAPLCRQPEDEQRRVGQLLFLHELFHHSEQDLRTSNHHEIGRAGVVLEEADFWADAFALSLLIRWELREGGERARRDTPGVAGRWIDAALSGIEAFDRFEQPGDRIERLSERRLRRYLTWHLQRERALGPLGAEDVAVLFAERLVVELAPLAGFLDRRSDKYVRGPLPETELFIALGGRLLRQGRYGASFDPAPLVEAVRRYDRQALGRAMAFLVDQHAKVLLPWQLRAAP